MTTVKQEKKKYKKLKTEIHLAYSTAEKEEEKRNTIAVCHKYVCIGQNNFEFSILKSSKASNSR